MKINNLAVIVPVDAGMDKNVLRETVWSKTVELLSPQLGKLYSRFEPAPSAWGLAVNRPFGVIVGKDDPALFTYFYANAKARQAEAIGFHMKHFTDNIKPLSKSETDHFAVFSLLVNGSDEATMAHLAWHLGMIEGTLFPDSGLYFLRQKESFASDELEKEVIGNLEKYAMCLVTLGLEAPAHEA